MRADVPIAITSWAALTPFGDLGTTLGLIHGGSCIDDHAQATPPGEHHRAGMLAFAVARRVAQKGIRPDCAVIVGTSKGNIEDWFDPPASDNSREGLSPSGLGVLA